MLYRALKEIDNGGVAGSPMPFGKQTQGVGGSGGVAQQRVRARAPMVVEQTPQSSSTRQMLDFTNAESPLGRQSESLEEFWESLNKFKEEEGTSGEACVQSSRVEGPRAPPTPIPQAPEKQPQLAKQFVKAVQPQAQEAKPRQSNFQNPSSSQVVCRARSGRRSRTRMIVVTIQAPSSPTGVRIVRIPHAHSNHGQRRSQR